MGVGRAGSAAMFALAGVQHCSYKRNAKMLRALMLALGLFAASALSNAAQEAKFSPGMVNPRYHESPPWFKESFLDLREDMAEARKANRRVMLYFYQEGCPYCTKLLQDNFGQQAIADKTRKHFDVIAINIWGDREVTDMAARVAAEKAFARALRIQFTPTLLMLDERGDMALRLNGYIPPHKFDVARDCAGQRLKKTQSFTDYLKANFKESASGKLHREPWLLKPPLMFADRLKRGASRCWCCSSRKSAPLATNCTARRRPAPMWPDY